MLTGRVEVFSHAVCESRAEAAGWEGSFSCATGHSSDQRLDRLHHGLEDLGCGLDACARADLEADGVLSTIHGKWLGSLPELVAPPANDIGPIG